MAVGVLMAWDYMCDYGVRRHITHTHTQTHICVYVSAAGAHASHKFKGGLGLVRKVRPLARDLLAFIPQRIGPS